MCHRIAELMEQSSRAPEAAAREAAANTCESLIFRLWERRATWSRGWRTSPATRQMGRIAHLNGGDNAGHEQAPREVAGSWTDTFPLLLDLHAEELQIWHEETLLEEEVFALQVRLEENVDAASESGRSAIEDQLAEFAMARPRAMSLLFERMERSDGDIGMTRDLRRRLEDIQARRSALVDRVVDPPIERK